MVFNKIKRLLTGSGPGDESSEDYIEIDLGKEERETKVLVKLFSLKQYEDVNEILNALREGYTVALINIKPLKDKDLVELKRAVSKLKKTCEAIEGDIAGFGEDWIVITPSFAQIYRGSGPSPTELPPEQ